MKDLIESNIEIKYRYPARYNYYYNHILILKCDIVCRKNDIRINKLPLIFKKKFLIKKYARLLDINNIYIYLCSFQAVIYCIISQLSRFKIVI